MSAVLPKLSGCAASETSQGHDYETEWGDTHAQSVPCCGVGSALTDMHDTSIPAEAMIQPGTVNVHARLSCEGKAARLALLDHMINTGHPFDQASESLGTHDAFLHELEAKHVFARNSAGHIAFAYPVSAVPTAHKVFLADRRRFFAMCAVDAMGSHFALQQNIIIHSRCAQSGTPVQISITDGMIDSLSPTETHAIHVDLTKFTNWAASC